MKFLIFTCLFLIGGLYALAKEPQTGMLLHNTHCSKCHGSAVYTRKNRRIKTVTQLEAQVRRCEGQLGLQWFDEEVHAVAGYLNKKYYRFE